MQIGLGELLEELERDLHLVTINRRAQAMQQRRFGMKPSALFALLVAATAPQIVTAQPKTEEPTERVRLTDYDAPAKRNAARHPAEWAELASATPAKHGRVFIGVGRDAGTFRKLRFEAGKGKVIVLRVKVTFVDGTTKIYPVDKRLDAKRQKSTVIDLKTEKPIEQIVVKTETYTNGAYVVHGSSSPGVVAGR